MLVEVSEKVVLRLEFVSHQRGLDGVEPEVLQREVRLAVLLQQQRLRLLLDGAEVEGAHVAFLLQVVDDLAQSDAVHEGVSRGQRLGVVREHHEERVRGNPDQHYERNHDNRDHLYHLFDLAEGREWAV